MYALFLFYCWLLFKQHIDVGVLLDLFIVLYLNTEHLLSC